MGIKLAEFAPGKEQAFEENVLHFASDLYGSPATKNWTCMIIHIQDPAKWCDLFDIARFSHLSPEPWCDSDAYSSGWDEPTLAGWRHADRSRRRVLAKMIGLTRFDSEIGKRAPLYDMITFLNDPLQNWIANLHKMPTYNLYCLVHESLHFCEDWTHKNLVIDGVPPWEDKYTIATLNAYIEHCGGWAAFKEQYLL